MRDPPANDQRRSQRMPATLSARLLVESEGSTVEHEASTVDISLDGVKVRTRLVLLPGETVGIAAKGETRHAISARVVWVERAGTEPLSLAGLEFLESLPA